ncbi:hypothetical protein [Brevundimonas diminuta]|uniref:hypothetical protein n=1 Tax=Brevundimonas diminuta TaxID=293 RepID=UPI000207EC8F|nr:hypothetical protein [Brevundimonas diminuta]EGF96767.1 hypothetical protein BDIM_05750 [Brevundimonas diminuta ATCC 11568]OWR16585.1 hypothetical protein CD944_16330 [Brevundimonas diminuta]WQE44803.1 hypothetical protein U0020_14585 [Brevundimonas diminuta]SUW17316.1 Uncharacterised protein [Brevundimonas diminuta]
MDEDDIRDDPNYRFGVIMGRMQTLTDIMALFAQGDAADDDLPGQLRDIVRRQETISRWMDQTKAECDAEAEMLHAELKAAEQD